MNYTLVFWVPILILFLSTAIGAIIKNRSRDICLKAFDTNFVLIKTTEEKWYWGGLAVFSNSLELVFRGEDRTDQGFAKLSYIFYEPELNNIAWVIRPVLSGNPAVIERWQAEIRTLLHRTRKQKVSRKARNLFNIFRDAFTQSIGLLVGLFKAKSKLIQAPLVEQQTNDIGKTLLQVVPNAYEPVLEKYIGRQVIIESIKPGVLPEHITVLEEYSDKFILVRDVKPRFQLPPEVADLCASGYFDAIFSRRVALIRHLASSLQRNPELTDSSHPFLDKKIGRNPDCLSRAAGPE
jgi:hypothetical protein